MSSSFWRFNHKKILKDQVLGNKKNNKKSIDHFKPREKDNGKAKLIWGKSWDTQSLRLKSDLDLKMLWYKVIIERNRMSSTYSNAKQMNYKLLYKPIPTIHKILTLTLNRIKGVFTERNTHRNNCMTFLEFYDYKKGQYNNLYYSKFPADRNIENPMFSSTEIEKMNIIKDYISTYKEINLIDEIYDESLDWDRINMLNENFNVFDPFNLLSVFQSKNTCNSFNKVMIAKKLLIENLRTTQVIMREIDNTIKVVKLNNEESINNNDNQNNNVNSEIVINTNSELSSLSDFNSELFKKLSENLRRRILSLTENKKINNQTCTKFLESGIEYFKDEDGKVFHKDNYNKSEKIKETMNKFNKYILKVRNDNNTTLESLDHFVSVYENYINKVQDELVLLSANKRLSEKEYIKNLKKNPKYRSLDKKINFFKTKLDNNILLADFELEKERIYLDIFKKKLSNIKQNDLKDNEKNIEEISFFLNEKVNSRIIDEGFKKILFVEIPNVVKFENKILNKVILLKDKEEILNPLYQTKNEVSVVSDRESNVIKDLTTKNKSSEIIAKYVENHEQFNIKQKRILFNKIQYDRAQLAKNISIKEMALISSQASKIKRQIDSSVDIIKSLQEMILKAESMKNYELASVLKEKYEFEKNKSSNAEVNSNTDAPKYLNLIKKSASNYLADKRDNMVFERLKNTLKNNDEIIKTKLKKSKMV